MNRLATSTTTTDTAMMMVSIIGKTIIIAPAGSEVPR
jgi:hypothetical protein